MTDRLPGLPGQYRAQVSREALQKLQNGEPFALTLNRDDNPIKEGTPYSKAAVLPDELAGKLCPGVEDPTPADAFCALHQRTEDIGNKEEIFVADIFMLFQDSYAKITASSWDNIQQEGCSVYRFYYPSVDTEYSYLAGKTITIRTYMYGDMAVVDESELDRFAPVTNAEANINQNPESGIFEYEYTFPDDTYTAAVVISFCENPYFDKPKVIIHKGTVWEEIKNLQSVEGYDAVEAAATAVRYAAQSLTDTQKAQARANIGAVTLAEVLESLPIYNGEAEEV